MKNILCYGDSNTWGCSPADGSRFDENTRWPMVMESCLENEYRIIEDACCGRSVLDRNPVSPEGNGIEWIRKTAGSYPDLFLAIIFLGMNDIFSDRETPPALIAEGIGEITDTIIKEHEKRNRQRPRILLMAPPRINDSFECAQFYEIEINKSRAFPELCRNIAEQKNCLFIDTSSIVETSSLDGTHLDRDSHIKLGRRMAEFILRELL